jgi:hypothetical protein
MTEPEHKELEAQVDEWERNGIIEENHDGMWRLSIVTARKKDGSKRWTLDCRPVNEMTIPDSFPLLDRRYVQLPTGKKYFTWLDFCDGFWALEVEEESRGVFTFATRKNLYQWVRMPQGWINSMPKFQRRVNEALGDLMYKCVMLCVDDLIIMLSTWEEHQTHVKLVLEALRKANMFVKLRKCNFGMTELEYLGHIVTAEGDQAIRE